MYMLYSGFWLCSSWALPEGESTFSRSIDRSSVADENHSYVLISLVPKSAKNLHNGILIATTRYGLLLPSMSLLH